MNFLSKMLAYWIRFPAELKGMKFGKNSFIGPGYDWYFVNLKGITAGNDVMIGKNAWLQISAKGEISIGDGTHIGRNVTISAQEQVKIGKECLISYNVSILDHDHDYTDPHTSPMKSEVRKVAPIVIEDECFIGAHSFILSGVHLGKHCVVGANSVVTKSFPAYSMIAGNPAQLIKKIK